MRRLTGVLVVVVLLAGAFAQAQVCQSELGAALPGVDPGAPATGLDAALVLKRAVDLVEPALPRLRGGGNVPLAKDQPGYDEVRFLFERNLLPRGWTPEAIDAGTWQAMLDRFLGWYEIKRFEATPPSDVASLLADASRALERVSRAVRPAGLLASDPADRNRIAFWAIIWNWTVYPRLLVLAPRPDVDLSRGPRAVLERMGNCAVQVRSYVMAPAATATRLFLANNQSRMYVVAVEPRVVDDLPFEVPLGKELDAFAFGLRPLESVVEYAAVFDGPSVGLTTVLGLMTRVRTNLSPPGFLHVMQVPGG